MPRVAALIVAAGKSARAGQGLPKQYRMLAGKPVLRRAIEPFAAHPGISMICAVIGAADHDFYVSATAGLNLLPPVGGADTRQHSVQHGLTALSAHRPDFVLIHDAARPLVSSAAIDRVLAALASGAEAAIPLLPVVDTLKSDAEGWKTVSRAHLHRAQTPQGFKFAAILKAHYDFISQATTDDMALAEMAGLKIEAVAGDETNMKITTPQDFALAEKLLGAGGEFRTGMGFDAHRFTAGDHVWLCGMKIAHDRALQGHSDADAGLHALTDAILGALGAGDIGQHFPPTDARWKNAPSHKFLEHALALVRAANGAVVHCDVTLICERPKIAPHRDAMRARIADILGIDVARVSVKATTTEGMGFTGRGEGLAAQAVATLRLP
ncbi:MAG TPA: bifunctional 2-C-methyl-D-erythritol 4-phosphate cytidylyltransferase/2-C-methyl-D-erythritol 2,4-cyclodiphosphate synthase [Rhizomicrobium sp.]|jgi:2-C-methyl-D-erythritol 4-phosphate cytidylyltransferase/2-C-methyl-D-erythritol 2,4-cyclodiphosphate synthase